MAEASRWQWADHPLLQEGRRRWAQRQWQEAIDCFQRACLDGPRNVRAALELARALGQRYDVNRAVDLLDQVERAVGDDPQLAPLIAQSYRLVHRPQRALAALERLAKQNQLSPVFLAELAVLLEQTNRVDDAIEMIRRSIASAPGQPEPLLILARLLRVNGEWRDSLEILKQLVTRADADGMLRLRAWSELAQLYDARQDYGAAMEALERSKAGLRQLPQTASLWQRNASINAHLRTFYESLDRPTLERWRAESTDDPSNSNRLAHLLGFPRSGTTLLEQILSAHPELVSSPERPVFAQEILPTVRGDEAGPFSRASLERLTPTQCDSLRHSYVTLMEALLGEPLRGRVHLDKNPNHTSLLAGIVRILPTSRFLFAVRDPRDVLVSAYFQFLPLTEFSSSFLTWERCVEQYLLDMQIGHQMRVLDPEQSLVVRYEDLVEDMPSELRRVTDFLGLEWRDELLNYRSRDPHRIVNSPTQAAVRKPIHRQSIRRWRNYEEHLRPHLQRLQPWCERFGYS